MQFKYLHCWLDPGMSPNAFECRSSALGERLLLGLEPASARPQQHLKQLQGPDCM